MLVLATAGLAACATATTDVSVHRNAKADRGSQRVMVRGPVVPDAPAATRSVPVRHTAVQRTAPQRAGTTHRAVAAKPAPSKYVMREVPNPLRQAPPVQTTAPAPEVSTLPTEPVQPASIEQSWAQPDLPATTTAEVPIQDAPTGSADPSGSSFPSLTALLPGIGNITIDSIEETFGGMPFWLISVIAAALVATLGFALRRRSGKDEEEYEEPRVDDPEEDYREPYAA
jgi:hypothetical protein